MNRFKIYISTLALALSLVPKFVSAQILGIEGENHASIGIYVKDLKADTLVFASDADRNLVPASILKSYTSATALQQLGPDFRFKTQVQLVGDSLVGTSVFNGDIKIQPGGDPTLESAHFKENLGFTDSIVARIQRCGITTINGKVIVNDSETKGGPVPQWEIDDVAWAYGAGIHQFNFRDNTFTYNPATGKCSPEVPGLEVKVLPNKSGVDVVRGMWDESLYAFMPSRSKKNTFKSTVPFPAKVFEEELLDKLRKAGITVNDINSKYAGDACVTMLYEHQSVPLSDILKSLMFRSDNMFAEGCLLALAPGAERSLALDREKRLWTWKGFDSKYTTVVDGSGLARVNRVSARYMGEMLEYMARSPYGKQYSTFFPRVGKDGTVKRFLADTKLDGRLALKTGSMRGVHCYAGYALDEDGNPSHVIVMMVNGFYCTRDKLRTAIAKWFLNNINIEN